jgi:hypothetical protein
LAKIFRFFCPQKVPNIRAIGGKFWHFYPEN